MGKSIKHQFIHAIENGFKEGQDKHSMKRAGYERQSTIFSFADRKNLIDSASAFSNWLKEQGQSPKNLYDLKPAHVLAYLNAHTGKWTAQTYKVRMSHLRKLETLARKCYPNSTFRFMEGVERPQVATDSRRTLQVSEGDFQKLMDYASGSRSPAKRAVVLCGLCGLRVSEVAKLKGSDIQIGEGAASINVVDSKGKRSRTMSFLEQPTIAALTAIKLEVGNGRICPVQSESITTYLRRAFQSLGMKQYVQHKTCCHALRKLAAQRHFDACRAQGQRIRDGLSSTSVFLGHGRNRDELMKQYVLDIQ